MWFIWVSNVAYVHNQLLLLLILRLPSMLDHLLSLSLNISFRHHQMKLWSHVQNVFNLFKWPAKEKPEKFDIVFGVMWCICGYNRKRIFQQISIGTSSIPFTRAPEMTQLIKFNRQFNCTMNACGIYSVFDLIKLIIECISSPSAYLSYNISFHKCAYILIQEEKKI